MLWPGAERIAHRTKRGRTSVARAGSSHTLLFANPSLAPADCPRASVRLARTHDGRPCFVTDVISKVQTQPRPKPVAKLLLVRLNLPCAVSGPWPSTTPAEPLRYHSIARRGRSGAVLRRRPAPPFGERMCDFWEKAVSFVRNMVARRPVSTPAASFA